MILNIQPINITANRINIYTLPYHLDGSGATLYYELLNENNTIKQGNIELSEEEIADWGTDDNYIIELALAKIDVTKI